MFLQHIRDITDPEHPYSLEQLNVVEEDLITVQDESGYVKWVSSIYRGCEFARVCLLNAVGTDALSHLSNFCMMWLCRVQFTPTVQHCSMATLIGLCIRVKLLRSLPRRFKVRVSNVA